jgi:hypothetical protein
MPQMLCAMELALDSPRHVIIAGRPRDPDFRALVGVVHERLSPRRALLAITSEEERQRFAVRAPWLAELKPRDGRATAYVCEEFVCRAPVSDPDELRRGLGGEKI